MFNSVNRMKDTLSSRFSPVVYRHAFSLCLSAFVASACFAQQNSMESPGKGWASNSVNTVVFRRNSIVSLGAIQYTAWYNGQGTVMLAKRILPKGKWQVVTTHFNGNTADAHNDISIMVDGAGFLHMSWNHHNNPLHYVRSKQPGSLELTEEMSMTGRNESKVTYPEFYRLQNGDLLFLYRDGRSGAGNLVLNRYDLQTRQWVQLQDNLIDGQGKRNAYWQACTDTKGRFHISWVWRESGDVASNHDMCYARSDDGGRSWKKSTGEAYALPINSDNAEYLTRIPQGSELINQTSMCTDEAGNPFIASYWRDAGDSVPQYHILYRKKGTWAVQNTGFRKTPFSLSGGGTKRIPISRPQLLCWSVSGKTQLAILFRDAERHNRLSIALNADLPAGNWQIKDILQEDLGSWEPSFDTESWKQQKRLYIFTQKSEQEDGEGHSALEPQPVRIIGYQIQKHLP
jgi:hypothetical protein